MRKIKIYSYLLLLVILCAVGLCYYGHIYAVVGRILLSLVLAALSFMAITAIYAYQLDKRDQKAKSSMIILIAFLSIWIGFAAYRLLSNVNVTIIYDQTGRQTIVLLDGIALIVQHAPKIYNTVSNDQDRSYTISLSSSTTNSWAFGYGINACRVQFPHFGPIKVDVSGNCILYKKDISLIVNGKEYQLADCSGGIGIIWPTSRVIRIVCGDVQERK